MKKVLVFISIVLAVSCSNESELNNNTYRKENNLENFNNITSSSLPPIENEIDQMFYEYVTSIQYVNFQNALQNFYSKTNGTKSHIEFTTPENIFLWITTNLEKTDFVSVGQAVVEWDNLVELKHIELLEFADISQFIIENDLSVVEHYFTKWVLPVRATIEDECQENFDDCNNLADQSFLYDMGYYLSSTTGKDQSAIVSAVNAKYLQQLGYCAEQLLDCLGINN